MQDATTPNKEVAALHKEAAEVEKGAREVKQGARQLEQGVDHRNELAAEPYNLRGRAAPMLPGYAPGWRHWPAVSAQSRWAGVIPEWMIVVTGSILVLFSAFSFGPRSGAT